MAKHQSSGAGSLEADLVALGARILEARQDADLTQSQLAEAAGLHHVTISRIEAGKQSISVSSLILIGEALGVPAEKLLAERSAYLDAAPNG